MGILDTIKRGLEGTFQGKSSFANARPGGEGGIPLSLNCYLSVLQVYRPLPRLVCALVLERRFFDHLGDGIAENSDAFEVVVIRWKDFMVDLSPRSRREVRLLDSQPLKGRLIAKDLRYR